MPFFRKIFRPGPGHLRPMEEKRLAEKFAAARKGKEVARRGNVGA
jgi:hypothetical protein